MRPARAMPRQKASTPGTFSRRLFVLGQDKRVKAFDYVCMDPLRDVREVTAKMAASLDPHFPRRLSDPQDGRPRLLTRRHGGKFDDEPNPMSEATRQQLLSWIDEDREALVAFFSGFVKAKSPNPPGDTREAVAFLCKFLGRARASATRSSRRKRRCRTSSRRFTGPSAGTASRAQRSYRRLSGGRRRRLEARPLVRRRGRRVSCGGGAPPT